jgi:hypothetical protein
MRRLGRVTARSNARTRKAPCQAIAQGNNGEFLGYHIHLLTRPDHILKRKKRPLDDFIHIRDTLLLELCRHDGLRGLVADSSGFPLCGDCGESSGTLRCTECTADAMFCPRCMCAKHREQPLHRIQVCSNCPCPVRLILGFYSDGLARTLSCIRWLTLVLLFSSGMTGTLVQIPKFISAHLQLSTFLAFTRSIIASAAAYLGNQT